MVTPARSQFKPAERAPPSDSRGVVASDRFEPLRSRRGAADRARDLAVEV